VTPLHGAFPDSDREIKRGAQLIVRESQTAQFVYLGQFGDTFAPGKYSLVTDNIPVLTTLKGLEVRIRIALQGRRLLHQHASFHRQQVGHRRILS
jgi:membrane protease subunit (stomatin/prohibitin family)